MGTMIPADEPQPDHVILRPASLQFDVFFLYSLFFDSFPLVFMIQESVGYFFLIEKNESLCNILLVLFLSFRCIHSLLITSAVGQLDNF